MRISVLGTVSVFVIGSLFWMEFKSVESKLAKLFYLFCILGIVCLYVMIAYGGLVGSES